MATGGNVAGAFKEFADKAEKKEMSSRGCTKWFKDAKILTTKTCTSNNLDICFSKVKPKGKNNITVADVPKLVSEVAKSYSKDMKKSEEEAVTDINTKLCATKKDLASGTTKTSKTGGVGKMTDTSQYTGAHKERFGADGKGKGAEGRTDTQEHTGYTSQYKGKDTYEKKQ